MTNVEKVEQVGKELVQERAQKFEGAQKVEGKVGRKLASKKVQILARYACQEKLLS